MYFYFGKNAYSFRIPSMRNERLRRNKRSYAFFSVCGFVLHTLFYLWDDLYGWFNQRIFGETPNTKPAGSP